MLARFVPILWLIGLSEASESCHSKGANKGALLLQKGVQKTLVSVAAIDDDEEEDLPLFDNSPGRSGNGKPLKSCQGSCSSDDDCEGELKCITPKFVGWDGIVPGCRSDGFHKPLWEFKYCTPEPPAGWRTTTTTTTTPRSTPPPPDAPSVITNCPTAGVCARLMAFNVYYAQLGQEQRMEGIAQSVAEVIPDIAVITEQWNEQRQEWEWVGGC